MEIVLIVLGVVISITSHLIAYRLGEGKGLDTAIKMIKEND